MPQTVTFAIKTSFKEGGPKLPDATRENHVSANMFVKEEVPNDKDWHEFDVLGGSREEIEFMMLSASEYRDKHCPREDEPGILFKFTETDDFSLHLDGPLLYSGHTSSCLPNKVDKIYIQNRMAEKFTFYLLLGRKQKKKKKDEAQVQQLESPQDN